MAIRNLKEYKALLANINIQKEEYSKKELAGYNLIDNDLRIIEMRIKKLKLFFVIASAFLIVFLGTLDTFLTVINQKWVIYIYISIIMLIFLAFIILLLINKRCYNQKKKEINFEQTEKMNILDNVVALNKQISLLTMSIICLNEHFYELSLIEDENELKKRWQNLINEHLMAINMKYSSLLTTESFQNYYKEWENRHLED